MMHNVMRKVTLAALIALPTMVASAGCDKLEEARDAACCTDYKVGADLTSVDWGIEGKGNADFGAFMQASADFSASATALVGDLAVVCQELAVSLGAEDNAVNVNITDPGQRAKEWCNVVSARITAAGSIKIEAQPPVCSASLTAQASCEGKCSVEGSCDLDAGELPKCEGGELSFTCEGSCSGSCSGSAELAVTCDGTCEGSCNGTCEGTCEAKDGAGNCVGKCTGSCTGKCEGKCTAKAGVDVQCEGECSGSCSGKAKAPKCSGGKPPTLNCNASADCKASCSASVQAKAECKPGSVKVVAAGNFSARQVASLEASLPRIRALLEGKVKLLAGNAQAVIDIGASVTANVSLSAKATGCLIPAVESLKEAGSNLSATLEAGASISGSIGG